MINKLVPHSILALMGCSVLVGVWASPSNAEERTKVIRLDRAMNAAPQEMWVEDEFIVVFKQEFRGAMAATVNAVGRPVVTDASMQDDIDDAGVAKFHRQFPTATAEAANSPRPDLTGHYKVKLDQGVNLDAAMAVFANNPRVDHVEKIGIHPVYACATGTLTSPNDYYYDNPPPTFPYPQWDLWGSYGIDADKAWTLQTGDPTVVVVGMDTGVRYYHPDLGGPNPPGPSDNITNGNVWVNANEIPGNGVDDDGNGRIDDVIGWDFVTGNPSLCDSGGGEDCDVQDNDPRDYAGHGTHTAGTMAAITNNASGVAGVAGGFGDGTTSSAGTGSKIMCLRVGWQDILGRGFVRMDYVAEAMYYVATMKNSGVNIAAVNCSWGTSNSGGVGAAVSAALAADVLIVHAAGNSGSSTADYFGTISGVLDVAATDQNGLRASFSNYGSWVEVAAPGVAIVSTWHQYNDPGPNYVAALDGTSMAAPHVAGVAALLESCNPSLTRTDKFNLIVNNTCAAGSPNIGGILNAKLALDAAGCTGGCLTDPECDDGLYCNGAETCVGGTCQSGTAPNCNDGVGCTSDSCNEATDSCDNVPNNAACDDGLWCNGTETCNATLDCQAGTAPNCNDGVGCTVDSCNEGTDSCDNVPNNASCSDGVFCNGAETCDTLLDCQAGTAVDCTDGVGCTADSCNEATDSCDNVPNNAACDDGLWCNGAETCHATLDCQSGTAPNCNDGVGCTDDACNEATDSCDNVANDANCDNGLWCDGAETCDALLDCQAGTAPNCNDAIGCTADSCNEGTDSCDNVPNNAACDDGLFCNGAETCDALLDCQAGTAPDCNDGVACTDDSCNEVTDSCDNIANNANCDDGLFCNGTETCDALLDCQAGSNPCPGQSCDEVGDACVDCQGDPDCDDSLWCNGAETCVAGTCQAGTAPNCNDGVGCTADSCNEATDSCDHTTNDAACDNGLYCDGAETCDPVLDCVSGTAPDCNDGVGCTADSCNEATDSCDHIPNDAACNNGLYCDGVETCVPALDCQPGTAVNCGDGVGCTTDSCNEGTDSCDHVPSDAACDDGLFCNGAESCNPVLDCQAGSDPCPGEGCDEGGDACIPSLCNNGTCDSGEDCNTCAADCIGGTTSGAVCGNGVCEAGDGEDCITCPSDCNGLTSGKPANRFCCGATEGCGDSRCNTGGFYCTTTPSGGGMSYCCGDLTCEGPEDSFNCAVDCGAAPACGDATCDPGEDQCNCPSDCGTPPATETGLCTDGIDNDCDGAADCLDTTGDCNADPACTCGAAGSPCTTGSDCCTGSCKRNGTCR